MSTHRNWLAGAIRKLEADVNRSADTHLVPLALPGHPGIHLYLKDESSHPTGSLKHRLARSLFLHALANGWLQSGSTVVEASSGSTAVSEAYFARLLDLPFVAVMPRSTSPEKIAAIEFQGGRCHLVDDAGQIRAASEALARELRGHFMDQFTHAERATDWRANNNIAESIFQQMAREPHPVPAWVVCAAGTGGTSATLGRYMRYRGHATRLLCTDPEFSAFFGHYAQLHGAAHDLPAPRGSRIEGIGRPTVEPSFMPGCVDAMLRVPDALSLAAMRQTGRALGRLVGASTGTNMVGVLWLAQRMQAAGQQGSIVTILCDGGDRYARSYHHADWYRQQGIDTGDADQAIAAAWRGGPLPALQSVVAPD
jgi:cysteine synthase A